MGRPGAARFFPPASPRGPGPRHRSVLFIAPGPRPLPHLATPPRSCAPTRVPRSHCPFVELVSFIYYNTKSYIKFSIKAESFLP